MQRCACAVAKANAGCDDGGLVVNSSLPEEELTFEHLFLGLIALTPYAYVC